MYGIILAGGSGSRLWPLSRELYPKQLLKINNDESLLQSTFKRLMSFVNEKNIISITNVKHASNVQLQLSEISSSSTVLAEPIGRNTAPAIAVTLQYIKQNINENEIVVILPADHLINDINAFDNTLKKAEKIAKQGYIVTLGIKPSYPETGYGYIKTKEPFQDGFVVEKFVEKPDKATAEKYIAEGCYYWNGGIFVGQVSTFLEEFEKYAPQIAENAAKFDFAEGKKNIPYNTYDAMESISIDYAIMEKSTKVALVELESDWSDVGSWQSLYDIKEKDGQGNVIEGHVIANNLKNSLVYSSKKLVAVSGLEDVIIVDTEDAIMACRKDKSQDIKDIYAKLKEQNDNTHLVHKTVFRPWGYYTCLAEGEGYLTKMISVSPAQKLSIQSHNHRSEHWVVLEGEALVLLDDKEHFLKPGQSIDIDVKIKHSLQNPYEKELKIIEVQKGDYLSEDDIIR